MVMKKLEKISEIYNNKELKEMAIEQQERWLRAKIVMQFVFLREKLGYTQQEIADKMGVMRQQITRFENMSNSPTVFFLVKYILTTVPGRVILYLTKQLNERSTIVGIQTTIKALSDPIRREILEILKSGRLSAGEIAEKFPVSGAAISKHLSVLREADLIRDTREGKFIYYELNTSVLEEVMLWMSSLKGEKHD